MSKHQLAARVQKEIKMFHSSPPEHVPRMRVKDSDVSTVHFLVLGPKDTPFEGGEYVVELRLPPNYPMMPPRLRVRTPSGRFQVDTDVCATFTSHHPESWSPIYNFSTILRAFVSFMTDDDTVPFLGRADASVAERRRLAADSRAWNAAKGLSF
jgi:ubiquitin-conjugating enzyme E2 J2